MSQAFQALTSDLPKISDRRAQEIVSGSFVLEVSPRRLQETILRDFYFCLSAPEAELTGHVPNQGGWRSILEAESTPLSKSSQWEDAAREDLEQLDDVADDMDWERPGSVAVRYAKAFVEALAGISGLPLPSITPDEDRSVSIQMQGDRFIFLLTCRDDDTGIFNVSHDEYFLEGRYRNLKASGISSSKFFRQIRCLLHPITDGSVWNWR